MLPAGASFKIFLPTGGKSLNNQPVTLVSYARPSNNGSMTAAPI
jgi:hypothetical protein